MWLTILLQEDWVLSHSSCRPSTHPEKSSGWRSGIKHPVLWETGRTAFPLVRYFQERKIDEPNFFQLPSTKLLTCALWLTGTFYPDVCLIACSPSPKSHIYWRLHPTSLEQFLSAIWEVVFQATDLSKSSKKTETHSSHVVCFLFSWRFDDISF